MAREKAKFFVLPELEMFLHLIVLTSPPKSNYYSPTPVVVGGEVEFYVAGSIDYDVLDSL